MFVLILGHFWCSLVISVTLSSSLSIFEKKKKIIKIKNLNNFFLIQKSQETKQKIKISKKNPKKSKKKTIKTNKIQKIH